MEANVATPAVNRFGLLVAEIYPDSDDTLNPSGAAGAKLANGPDATYDRIEFMYDYASRKSTWKFQDMALYTYTCDLAGRLLSDQATALGSTIDRGVRRIEYGYEANDLSRLLTVSSYDGVSGSAKCMTSGILRANRARYRLRP
jgi:hypothetical protein